MHVPNIRAKKCLQVKELTATIRYVSADSTTRLIRVLKRGQFVVVLKAQKGIFKTGESKT
jgi:hypothetical protein